MRNLLVVFLGTLLLDQATKVLVVLFMDPGQSVALISDFARLTFVKNSGAAFGLLSGNRFPFVFTTVLAVVALVFFLVESKRKGTRDSLALSLILAGASGNLIDRLRLREVVDFMDLGWKDVRWPVFNVADIAITVGVFLFCYRLVFGKRRPA
ncbi:MAG: signal peptidase II [Candidatus Eisenbacteria bacterium]